MNDFARWLDIHTQGEGNLYVKRLSGNDTLANGTHQAGPYFSKPMLFDVFPALNRPDVKNPRVEFEMRTDSHGDRVTAKAIWYNNKMHGGTRDEVRITNLGGASSGLLDPDSTGAIAVFHFPGREGGACHVWVCSSKEDADHFVARVGPVDSGKVISWRASHAHYPEIQDESGKGKAKSMLRDDQLPPKWRREYPQPYEIVEMSCELCPAAKFPSVDKRLMARRETEFGLFLSVERAIELPLVRKGFKNVDAFVERAHSILQRRKSRSGLSLELQGRRILLEAGLVEGRDFSSQPKSEKGRQPDFLFPSEEAYKKADFPADSLRMLAAKTTCRDRWRQILTEADRVKTKHLLTLQEGVSPNQFAEMRGANVKLVVPEPLMGKYNEKLRGELMSLQDFLDEVARVSGR